MKYSLLILFTIYFLCSTQVHSQEKDNDLINLSLDELLEVNIVTASKHEERVIDTPSFVIVVSREQIQQRRYIHLGDLLADLPGIDIQRATQQTDYHEFTWRGHVGSHKFLILQNGIRVDSPTGEAIPIAENFPLHLAEQVEVLYGASAALYGADAFGGVVNMITETKDKKDKASITVATGNHHYRAYYLQANQHLGEHVFITVGGHQYSSNTADLSKDYAVYNTKIDAVTYSGKTVIAAKDREDFAAPIDSESAFLHVKLGDHLTLGMNHSFFRNSTSLGVKPSISLFTDTAQWNSEMNIAYAQGRFHFSDVLSGTTTLNYATYEVDPRSDFKSIFVDFEDSYTYVKGEKRGIEQQFDYHLNNNHLFSIGTSYEDFYSLPRLTNLGHPLDTHKPFSEQEYFYRDTDQSVPILFFDVDYTNTSFYFQAQSIWNDQFSSIAGLRYDDNSRYQSVFNPRLGIVYHPDSKTALKILYAEAFRAPAPHENFEHYGSFSGQQNDQGEYLSSYFHAPNPRLEPEKSRSLEVAFLKNWRGADMTLSSYYTKVDNVIAERAESVPTQFIPHAAILSTSIFDNLDTEVHYGMEGSVNYRHSFNPQVSGEFGGNYSFIDGHVDQTLEGKKLDLPYIARHKLKLGGTLKYRDRYFITSRISLIDRTSTYHMEPTGEQTQSPGYVLADLHLGATKIFKKLSVYLDIYNVLDTHYYNAGASSGELTLTAVPQQPRTFIVSLQYQF